MTLNILFTAGEERWEEYQSPLKDALATLDFSTNLRTDFEAQEVDYIIYAPNSWLQDFTPYNARTKAVLNLWAGVETVVRNPTLKIPLARMVEPSLTQGMCEWVCGHVMRHHLEMDQHIHNPDHVWAPKAPPLAWERTVGILGLGALGQASAQYLKQLGFKVSGWSRTEKVIEGVQCHNGQNGLNEILAQSEILVLLLPDTPQTQNIINAQTLSRMPKGAILINPGRGTLVNDDDLRAALNNNHIAHATLDTFRIEPLPHDDPYWAHPNVTVTPHIASETRHKYASLTLAKNIETFETKGVLLNEVDRHLGY